MPMRAIFISYRRDDTEGQSGRLYDDLVQRFGEGLVFMDVAGIEAGRDFRKVIDENVASCGVLLAVIGPTWLDAEDETGVRRLDNPMDFVRLETAAALKRDIPVVPVLVRGARMPKSEQLPDDLKELAYRNGLELTHARWDSDVEVLIKALQRHLPDKTPPPAETGKPLTPELPKTGREPYKKSRRTTIAVIAAAIVAAAAVGIFGARTIWSKKNATHPNESGTVSSPIRQIISSPATSFSSAPPTIASATLPAANASGAVLIKTEPPGAIVTLGDESKKSPATFKRIKVGSWPVKAEFDGYEASEQQVTVEENQISDPGVIKLIRSTGTARVSTSPEGTDFDLVDADGQHHTGKTPAELRDLPVGDGNIIFNRENMPSHSQGIKVGRNQVASIIWNTPVGNVSLARPQPSAAASPATSLAERSFTNSLGCKMVWIPSLRIWVAESEVTQREFTSLMDHNPSEPPVGLDFPVNSVTEPQAIEFCARLSRKEAAADKLPSGYAYTLPTDDQWTVFSGNASLDDSVTSQKIARTGPEPVKSKGANEYGLYDTRGNVWEWTRTRYDPSLNPPSVRAKFSGLDTNGLVLRGGSWRSKGDLLNKTTRGSNAPGLRDKTNGFRVVLAPAE
jgi:hypothetical protein